MEKRIEIIALPQAEEFLDTVSPRLEDRTTIKRTMKV